MSEIVNAKIDSTSLGFQDHGIFSISLGFDTSHFHIGLGGYALDEYDEQISARIDRRGYGTEFIKEILTTVGVDDWADVKGQLVRIELEGVGGATRVVGLGHVLEDKWFRPKDWFKERFGL